MKLSVDTMKVTFDALDMLTRKSHIMSAQHARVTADGDYVAIEASIGDVSVKRLLWDGQNHAYQTFNVNIPQVKNSLKGQSGDVDLVDGRLTFESGLSVNLDSIDNDSLVESTFVNDNMDSMVANFDVAGVIKQVVYAINKDDSRFHLDCACLHNNKIIATDGHRMEQRPFIIWPMDSELVDKKIMIPRHVCQIISGAKIKYGEFTAQQTETGSGYVVQFSSPSWFINWLSEGDYPDYTRVIRQDNGFMKQVSVNRKLLLSSVKSLTQTLDKKSPAINIKINGKIELSTSKASVVVPIVSTNVNESYRDIERILNGFYLQDALTACKDERVCIESCANIVNDMVFFKSQNQDSLIMPMRK